VISGLILGIAIAAGRFLVVWAARGKAIGQPNAVVFPGTLLVRLLFPSAAIGMAYAGIDALFLSPEHYMHDGNFQWWFLVIDFGGASLLLFYYPWPIKITSSKISQDGFLGYPKTVILWQEVEYVILDPLDNSAAACTKAGESIKHSSLHIDRGGFLMELQAHSEACRKQLDPAP